MLTVAHKFLASGFALVLCSAALGAAELRKDIEYARPGGVSLTLDASVPEGAGPFPAVIVVHGGGFAQGDKQTYVKPLFAPLTAARFAWFTINYRLAPQYPFPAATDDVSSAIEWVRAHAAEYKADPKRIALIGESAGAYLVDYAAINGPKDAHVSAVVSFYGPHDLLFEIQRQYQGKVNSVFQAFAGVTSPLDAAGIQRFKEISPYYLVHKHLPPFLLIHGTDDKVVFFEQSVRFRRALEDHDVRCELFSVEGAGHGMESWESDPGKQEYKEKMIEWLRASLR
jgi:alpha-L-fucosidase 2